MLANLKTMLNIFSKLTFRDWGVFVAIFISILSLFLTFFQFWDNKWNMKIGITASKQGKLFVTILNQDNKTSNRPCVFMNLAIANYGGKTAYLDDIRLKVKLLSQNKIIFENYFDSLREYDTILGSGENIKQQEINPFVVLGKSIESRKLVFVSNKLFESKNIPRNFDLHYEIIEMRNGKEISHGNYESVNISDIWQDLEESLFKYSNTEIYKIKY